MSAQRKNRSRLAKVVTSSLALAGGCQGELDQASAAISIAMTTEAVRSRSAVELRAFIGRSADWTSSRCQPAISRSRYQRLVFRDVHRAKPPTYELTLLSGQGKP